VVQLHREVAAIHEAGAELHVIGNGAPAFLEGFRETTGYDGPLYTDPSLAVYHAAELRSGLRTVLTMGALTRTIGAFRRGFRQGRTRGSALQQGGVMVVAAGQVVWHHVSTGPGDNATARQIITALNDRS